MQRFILGKAVLDEIKDYLIVAWFFVEPRLVQLAVTGPIVLAVSVAAAAGSASRLDVLDMVVRTCTS